jgi:hypothetical protein
VEVICNFFYCSRYTTFLLILQSYAVVRIQNCIHTEFILCRIGYVCVIRLGIGGGAHVIFEQVSQSVICLDSRLLQFWSWCILHCNCVTIFNRLHQFHRSPTPRSGHKFTSCLDLLLNSTQTKKLFISLMKFQNWLVFTPSSFWSIKSWETPSCINAWFLTVTKVRWIL